jgi:hypothetical protein
VSEPHIALGPVIVAMAAAVLLAGLAVGLHFVLRRKGEGGD